MRGAWHVWEKKQKCIDGFGLKPEGKNRPLGDPTRIFEDNIKIYKEIGPYDVDWLHLAQNMGKWQPLIKTITKLRISVLVKMGGRSRNCLLNNNVRTNMYKAYTVQKADVGRRSFLDNFT